AWLDTHFIIHKPETVGIAPGAPRAHVELPAMPGTAQHLAGPRILVGARLRRQHETGEPAAGEAATLVRTLIRQGKQLALDVEDDDVAARDGAGPARPGGRALSSGDDVARHQASR